MSLPIIKPIHAGAKVVGRFANNDTAMVKQAIAAIIGQTDFESATLHAVLALNLKYMGVCAGIRPHTLPHLRLCHGDS